VITSAKAMNKAERVSKSSRNGLVQYDRREYAARLKVAAHEVGVTGREISRTDSRGAESERDRCGGEKLTALAHLQSVSLHRRGLRVES